MKKLRAMLGLVLALCLLAAVPANAAQAYYAYDNYDYLLGSMEIVNVKNYTTMRDYPGSSGNKIARVPAGAVVVNCYYYDDKYTYCEYDGMGGYISNNNLSFIAGPVGYEYPDEAYLGNFQIVNCQSYATLRTYPDTSSQAVTRVPLGSIVTNVFYQDERFSYCVFGDMDGYILNSNLSWISGGSYENGAYEGSAQSSTWIGTAVIVNCQSYASLRQMPDTRSTRLARVPLGEYVYNCYIVDDRFAYGEYGGIGGYILLDNLGW